MASDNCYALLFSPHPDDADIGMGGTVALWTGQGKQIVFVICTNGDKGSEDPDMMPQKLADMREKEETNAASVLGVKNVIFLRHPDQTLEDTAEFRKEIVRLIRFYRPQIVATADMQSPRIIHRDHRITGQVVLDAVYPFARNRPAYPDLIKEGMEPHVVREILLWGTAQPDYYIDITNTFEQKIKALQCHHSQFGDFDSSIQAWLQRRHSDWGKIKGFQLAEAFRKIAIEW
ncbi:MAG TPA: PIG-L deacetylase family protein [Dehalococcoidia bacterium]|nr:PIG-L deacetylase family protein [Dehalococcoidia bacterium]